MEYYIKVSVYGVEWQTLKFFFNVFLYLDGICMYCLDISIRWVTSMECCMKAVVSRGQS